MRFFARRGFDGLLVLLGMAALFCMIGSTLALVAAISIIGLPITFLMALTPPVFFFLLTVRIARLALPFKGGWVAAVAVACAVFTAVPWLVNQRLAATAAALVEGDLDAVDKPIAARSLAVISQWLPFNRDQTPCDDFCMRALLSGALDRVLVAEQKEQDAPFDANAPAVAFRMERRTNCPMVNLQSGVQKLDIDRASPQARPADPAEMMRLEIASGNCLVEAPALVGDADAVVRIGRIKQGRTPYGAGLDLFADTVRADRISYWQRSSGDFAERYRWTGVETYKLLPVLAPSYVTGYGLEIGNGFLRMSERINITAKYYEAPDRTAFFTDRLGMALGLDAASVDQLRTAALNQRLDAPGALDPVAAQIAEDFFHTIVLRNRMTAAEAEQGLRIVADARIPVLRGVHVLAQHAGSMPAGIQARTGDVLIARLTRLDRPVTPAERSGWEDEASALGGAIRYVPAAALASHRQALERMAHSEALRVPAWQAMVRLADFGAGAVPTLLYLVDDAERFRKDSGNNWQHPYLAGLIGICKLGDAGGAAVAPLLARIDGGLMPVHASYGELAVNTLVAIGGEPEAVWRQMLARDPKADRQRFDRVVSRAERKPDCTY